MARITIAVLFLLGVFSLFVGSVQAGDCSGGWQKLPNYRGGGGACKQLGLDSHNGVCQPGYQYETLCDDASGGRYRTCQGPRRCGGGGGNYYPQAPPQPQQQNNDCTRWDYKHNRPCPNGYLNNDCIGTCESLPSPGSYAPPQQNNCMYWDYSRNQPCAPGYINRDCRGGCSRQ